jgi:hypothetical protein
VFCVLLAATATRAIAAPAGAGPGPLGPSPVVGVHLSWVRNDAAADCPDAAAIEAEVASRLGDNPFRRTATQFIEAVITRQAETLQATIAMRSTDGKLMGSRTLASTSRDCRSIANAAALTIAILIDPDALMRPPVPPPPPPPRSPLPSLGIALAATLEVGRRAAIGITGTFLPERRTSAPNDGFAFGLSTGELDGCFVPVAGGSAAVRAELCGGLSAGLLDAVVYTPAPLDPGQRWAFAATQLMRLVIPLFRAGVLEMGAELAEPFPRRSFFVEGQPAGMDTVFTQPALAVTGFVGLGLRWR